MFSVREKNSDKIKAGGNVGSSEKGALAQLIQDTILMSPTNRELLDPAC